MNILYIDIDSLRPDHLGCYGYHRATSPNIDAIASEGLLCRNVYASDAPCMPSRTALYSGRLGIQTGAVGHGQTAGDPKVSGPSRSFGDLFREAGLAGNLRKRGFHTAMISPFGDRHSAHWIYAGFNELHNTGEQGMESAETVQPVVEGWLERNATGEPWYLHVNYWDPHTPYRVPKDYGDPFASDPLPAWLETPGLIEAHNRMGGPHSSLDIGMYDDRIHPQFPRQPGRVTNLDEMRSMIDGYDTAVRYVDEQIGRIVAQLKRAGVYDDTAIIISADHGENLGELGIYAEHGTADHITCRVPMIIKYPGGVRGADDNGLRYALDLVPTLLELQGGNPHPVWDGISFAAALRGMQDAGREDLVISQCAHVCQRSVRWESWLYMRTYHDGFHPFPQEMLFDLATDPHEQRNLAGERLDLCQEGAWRLARWHDAQMQKMAVWSSDVVDPLWTVIREGGPQHANLSSQPHAKPGWTGFIAYLKRLEETGRGEAAARLRGQWAGRVPRLDI